MLDEDGTGRQQQERGRPAQCGGAPHQTGQDQADSRYIVNAKVRRQQMRQDEAGHRCGGDQAGNRIQAELRQTGKAGQQQRGKAEYRGQHAEADGGPEAPDPVLPVCPSMFRLHKQVD